MRPISGCWFSRLYNREVPDRNTPTTKTGFLFMITPLRTIDFEHNAAETLKNQSDFGSGDGSSPLESRFTL
jgi:hypothetical protein